MIHGQKLESIGSQATMKYIKKNRAIKANAITIIIPHRILLKNPFGGFVKSVFNILNTNKFKRACQCKTEGRDTVTQQTDKTLQSKTPRRTAYPCLF